jgi:hypothetical protein
LLAPLRSAVAVPDLVVDLFVSAIHRSFADTAVTHEWCSTSRLDRSNPRAPRTTA